MRGHWGHYGQHHMGRHWGHYYGGRHRRGVVWFWPGLILLFVLVFGVMKFLWPLLLIGFIILAAKGVCHPAGRKRDDWNEKLKNDEKPKREAVDDRRYIQTEDGDWLEIV